MTNFKKSNIIFGAIALVAILAIGAVFTFDGNSNIITSEEQRSNETSLDMTTRGALSRADFSNEDEFLREIPYAGLMTKFLMDEPEVPEGKVLADARNFAQSDGYVYRVHVFTDGTESEAWVVGQTAFHTRRGHNGRNSYSIPATPTIRDCCENGKNGYICPHAPTDSRDVARRNYSDCCCR
jgi:hypothetical protein